MIEIPTLATARLLLRPFTLGDADDLFGIRGDPEAMAHWDWPHDESRAETQVIAEAMHNDMASGAALYWTARTRDGGFVGVFDVSEIDGRTPNLGFMVLRRMWGMGYGWEGASAIVAEAWRRGFTALAARIHAGNARSARLLARLGFVETGGTAPLRVRPGVDVLCRCFLLRRPRGGG